MGVLLLAFVSWPSGANIELEFSDVGAGNAYAFGRPHIFIIMDIRATVGLRRVRAISYALGAA